MDKENSKSRPLPGPRIGVVSLFLLVFAASGWLVLIMNMFGLAGRSGWIFPMVEDIPGLAASTLLLAVLAMTPTALKYLFGRKGKAQ